MSLFTGLVTVKLSLKLVGNHNCIMENNFYRFAIQPTKLDQKTTRITIRRLNSCRILYLYLILILAMQCSQKERSKIFCLALGNHDGNFQRNKRQIRNYFHFYQEEIITCLWGSRRDTSSKRSTLSYGTDEQGNSLEGFITACISIPGWVRIGIEEKHFVQSQTLITS